MAIRLTLSRTQKPLFCESKWWGDPDMPADMEYPVEPVGVATTIPSPEKLMMRSPSQQA